MYDNDGGEQEYEQILKAFSQPHGRLSLPITAFSSSIRISRTTSPERVRNVVCWFCYPTYLSVRGREDVLYVEAYKVFNVHIGIDL